MYILHKKLFWRFITMSDIFAMIIFVIMVILGAGSSLAIVGYMVWILIQKFIGVIFQGKSMYQ